MKRPENPYKDKVADGCFEKQVFERGADAMFGEMVGTLKKLGWNRAAEDLILYYGKAV